MFGLILSLAAVGFLCYLAVTFIPMSELFKKLIIGVVAVCMIAYLMKVFGFVDIPIPRLWNR